MKKKSILISSIFLFCLTFQLFAEDSPIQNYKYWHKLYGEVELTMDDGTKKSFNSIEQVFDETDGWTYIEGSGKIHYWLYHTDSNDDCSCLLLYTILPEWVEKMGYVIDYAKMGNIVICPDEGVPYSVQRLMSQRGRDVAVALITSDTSYPYGRYSSSSYFLVIHCGPRAGDDYYDYCTFIYPLY